MGKYFVYYVHDFELGFALRLHNILMIISSHVLPHFKNLVLVYFGANIVHVLFEHCLLNVGLQIVVGNIVDDSEPCVATDEITFDLCYGSVDDRRPDAKGHAERSDDAFVLES